MQRWTNRALTIVFSFLSGYWFISVFPLFDLHSLLFDLMSLWSTHTFIAIIISMPRVFLSFYTLNVNTFCHYTLFNLKHTLLFTLDLSLQCTRVKNLQKKTVQHHMCDGRVSHISLPPIHTITWILFFSLV